MRHAPIESSLFVENRARLRKLLPKGAVAAVNANDILPTNADGSLPLVPNSDLFYLSGVEQEESILVLAPDAADEKQREVLFLRETNEHLAIWEGHKLTKDEARTTSGVQNVKWLSEFPTIWHGLMSDAEEVFLNSNEHKRAAIEVETRDSRFIAECRSRFPLHTYRRLAPLLHRLRVVKSAAEVELLKKAVSITDAGFRRAARSVKPGVYEHELEAEFAHEFVRNRAKFAYTPIIASGANACVLHYIANDQPCRAGDLLLMDVAANYANYNADLTRTVPVDGRFTPRQRAVYDAVLRVMRGSIQGATIGKLHRDWTREAQMMMDEELVKLGLLTAADVKNAKPDEPACRKYFMHGLGHPLGLDVHDVGRMHEPFAAGWVLTVEPGIYIRDEGIGIRLENDVLLTDAGPIDLMADTPVDAEAIEELMR
ncbi:MAG: aminopeptidase P N-terminal domain-containing protein [Planctomycetaceae bacterium]|nr:aminopeptidase P N-terminal domain-containing protein [Planctomycetaceae bacterium]